MDAFGSTKKMSLLESITQYNLTPVQRNKPANCARTLKLKVLSVGVALLLSSACLKTSPKSTPSSSSYATFSMVLYSASPVKLRDSKWGKISEFQKSLSKILQHCQQPTIVANGIFDQTLVRTIQSLSNCPHFPQRASKPILEGNIDNWLWNTIAGSSLPTVHERAFVLSLSHEATDYDQAEWNLNTSDAKSILTWGPYGATVGHGREVITILKQIQTSHPKLIQEAFAQEASQLEIILSSHSPEQEKLLQEIYSEPNRRLFWKQAFARLGSFKEVQKIYENYALHSEAWLKPALRRLYTLIPKAEATEIDYAFFLDIAMHMSISRERIEKTYQAIRAKEKITDQPLRPAERRQVIALTLIPNQRKNDRLGRNVVYYIDGLGETKLSQEERETWKQRTGRLASQVGLSDERKYSPDL